jgi:hypothetical protein
VIEVKFEIGDKVKITGLPKGWRSWKAFPGLKGKIGRVEGIERENDRVYYVVDTIGLYPHLDWYKPNSLTKVRE